MFGCWNGAWESGSKGFRLHVNGDLSWGLFEEKVGEVKEGQGRNLLGGNQRSSIRLSGYGFWRFALICRGTHLPCRNSRVKKSGIIELVSPLIYSISKSKTLKIDCHQVKLCLETRF